MTGIVDCAVALPRYHVTAEAYDEAVGRFSARISRKAVTGFDEDALTMGVDAARRVPVADPTLLAVATTSPPQPGTLAAGPLSRALSVQGGLRTMEFGSSWKAGTEALDAALDADAGLAVVADDPRADPAEDADHVLGAGAVALATGADPLAAVVGSAHHVDARVPPKFRAGGVTDLSLGEYTASGYADAVGSVVEGALADAGLAVDDVAHAILPQEDVKTAWQTGLDLGFDPEQLSTGFVVDRVGFAGAAAPLLGLAAALDASDPGDAVLVSGYGHGHGASAFVFRATERIEGASSGYRSQIDGSEAISYVTYLELAGGCA
jgi:3-hydroxy-3-methylglutaryl CoA synthase